MLKRSARFRFKRFEVKLSRALIMAVCAWLLITLNTAYAQQAECCVGMMTMVAAADEPSSATQAKDSSAQQTARDIPTGQVPTATETYWPWWLGALALGTLTLAFWIVLGVPLGVSNSWDKVSVWRRERVREQQEVDVTTSDPLSIRDALLAETLAQFGPNAMDKYTAAPTAPVDQTRANRRAPVSSHLTFLLMIGVGGFIAAVLNGGFAVSFDLGPVHSAYFGDGVAMLVVLFIGGALAGFGARLGGGCTSGHGLSGLSCLQLGSLVSTMSFFGAAILTSLLIEYLL